MMETIAVGVKAGGSGGAALRHWVARARLLVWKRAVPLLLHLRSHRRLMTTLNHPITRPLLHRYPTIRYKYLRENYLLHSLSTAQSLEVMNYHYSVLGACVSPNFFPQLLGQSLVLWQEEVNGATFRVRLSFPRDAKLPDRLHDHEGDIAIIFESDAVPLSVLCMTLVPEKIAFHCWGIADASRALFVGRIQGVPGKFDTLRAATKAMKDIIPARILLCAVEAIGRALGVDRIVGVSTTRQLSYGKTAEVGTFFDYDDFWRQLGGEERADGLFLLPASLVEKAIEQVAQKHRSRTLAKRRYRKSIEDAIHANFALKFMAQPTSAV
ncbi:DUF535 family protein [Rugamonas sp.]|uniref:DUF535 family protein n=1 Tax=Rugamonas sp. TaxID=1926287 RepID=UPI0025D8EB58|nr:DUF535 family protein [Rugamonas sp.]